MNKINKIRTCICLVIAFIVCFLLVWCGSSNNNIDNNLEIEIKGFTLNTDGYFQLQNIPLSSEDLEEIIALYQEAWTDTNYRDSLLVAERYGLKLWVDRFVKENLDSLKINWLTVKDIKQTQINLIKNGKNIKSILVEYEITEWFIPEVPILYVSDLFIPVDSNILIFSFITEKSSVRSKASKMFKKIKA